MVDTRLKTLNNLNNRQNMEITKDNAQDELLKFRDESRITQIQAAAKSGISKDTISNIENGNFAPNKMTLYRLNKMINQK